MASFIQKFMSMTQTIYRLLDERVYYNDLLNKSIMIGVSIFSFFDKLGCFT